MPEFLSPTFWIAGAAAASLPIIIHLLLRNKAIKVEFAAMRFLAHSQKPVVRWLKLKQFLVLLLRILAIAILGLAFARPFFPETDALVLWGDDKREIGVIMDASASMKTVGHAEAARSELEKLLADLDENAVVSICIVGREAEMVVERAQPFAGMAAQALARFKPTFYQSNLREALLFMDDVLRGSPLPLREIYIISDFQKTSWPKNNAPVQLASNADVKLLPVAEERWSNIAILDAKIPDDREQPILCTVQDYSGGKIREAEVKLNVRGKAVATQKINFLTTKTVVVEFDQKKVPTGQNTGFFEISAEGDRFAEDDRFYFVSYQRDAVEILAVNGEQAAAASDELFFVERAVNVKGSDFNLNKIDPTSLTRLNPEAFDIVLLANLKGMNRKSLENVKAFVENGGGLLLAPGDKIDPTHFNRLFEEIAPAKIERTAQKFIDPQVGDLVLLNDTEHPALSLFADPVNGDLSGARFFQHWVCEAKSGAQILASFNDGSPAILAYTMGRGKIIMLSFPLDSEWADLPIQAVYLPFLHSVLSYLKPPKEQMLTKTVGKPLFLGDRFTGSKTVELSLPNGDDETLAPGSLIYSAADAPGFYQFSQGSKKLAYAVNLPQTESDSEVMVAEAFLAKVDHSVERTSLDKNESIASLSNGQHEARQKFWKTLLAVLVVILLSESLLANRTPR